ncbi:MAG: hypothetical protein FWD63_06415, partial [Propionibacteriaceae bacterium]|nr:hypothetical protein [Propionibacteriaceae bacterium]
MLAVYSPSTKTVRHIDCASTVEPPAELNRGVAGASAMREYERREAKDEASIQQRTDEVQAV